jgi:hypothetical protein
LKKYSRVPRRIRIFLRFAIDRAENVKFLAVIPYHLDVHFRRVEHLQKLLPDRIGEFDTRQAVCFYNTDERHRDGAVGRDVIDMAQFGVIPDADIQHVERADDVRLVDTGLVRRAAGFGRSARGRGFPFRLPDRARHIGTDMGRLRHGGRGFGGRLGISGCFRRGRVRLCCATRR